jgi:gliding motility-associated-like protein
LNLFAPDTTTTYYVRWENNCGQSAWDSIVVVVNEPFAPPVLSADTNGFCSDYGLPVYLSGVGGNGDTLRWFTQACGGLELGVGNPLSITAPTDTTTYYARYENNCGVSECTSFTINVVPAPTLFAGGLDSVCEAGAYQIANTWAENFTSVLWTTSGTGTFDDPTSLTPLYTLGTDDVVDQDTVKLVMSAQGLAPCGIYTDTLTLLINPLPVLAFMPSDTAICRDSSLVILTSGALTYDWRPSSGITQAGDQIFVANPDFSTNYKIIGTSPSGCVDSTNYNITVHPTPFINLGEDQYLFTCEPVILDAGQGTGSDRYEWQDGSRRQHFKVEENGTYWVKVSNNGCTVIDTIKVQICEGYIWMPTAFTPNSDGVNETFQARSSDLTVKFQMYIFSRNGMLVFQTDDITTGWDGMNLKGEICPSGVYVWKIVYQGDGTTSPGVEKTQSGIVTHLHQNQLLHLLHHHHQEKDHHHHHHHQQQKNQNHPHHQ